MALNSMGLGLLFEAKDLASGVMARVGHNFLDLAGSSTEAGHAIKASLKEFGLGMGIFAAGVAGLALLGRPLQSAKAFEAAIAEVTTETDEATFSTKAMRDISLQLAGTFGKMPVEEAKGLYQAVAAGATDAASATALMTVANKLAIGGVTDTTTAIDGITTALNAYGLAYTDKNIIGVSDAFFVAMADGKTKVGELASQIGRVAPSAKALGISFDEVLASVSAMTGQGLKADMAITGLHGALANIVHPAGDAGAEASRLKIKFNQTELAAKGWKGFLDEITHAAGFNATSMSKLFNSVEGLNAIQALTADGSKKFNSILGDMANKSGRTNNAFDKMSTTLEFAENRFDALKEVASVLIGDALVPMAKAVLRVASTVLEAFNKIPAPIKAFVTHLFAGAAAAMAVVGAIVALKGALGVLSAGLEMVGITAEGVMASLLPVIGTIALVVGAVVALKYAIDNNIGGIGDFFAEVWGDITLGFNAVVQLFTDGGFSGAVLDDLENGHDGLENFAIQVYVWANRIGEFFSAIGDEFLDVMGDMGPTFQEFATILEDIAVDLGHLSVDVQGNAEAWATWGGAGARVGHLLADVLGVVLKVINGGLIVIEGFTHKWSTMGDTIGPFGDALEDIESAVVVLLQDLGLLVVNGDGAGTSLGSLGAVLAGTLSVALDIVSSALHVVSALIKDIGAIFGGVVDLVVGLVHGDWARAWYGMREIAFGVVQGIIDIVMGLGSLVADLIDSISKATGGSTHLGSDLRKYRDEQRASLYEGMGLTDVGEDFGQGRRRPRHDAEAPVGSQFGPPAPADMPAVAAAAGAVSGDPGAAFAAHTAAITAAIAKASNPNLVAGTVNIDGHKLGELMLEIMASSGQQSGAPIGTGG